MIIVGGEMLVDLVGSMGDEHTYTRPLEPLAPALGGGPFNVAITAGRQEADVSFLTAMGTDHYAHAARARLADSNVKLDYVQESSRPTSLAVAMTDPQGVAHYTFYMDGTADRYVTDPGPLPHADIVCLGTCAMVLEPGASVYEAIMRRESARGAAIALDPNIRPLLIPDATAYRSRFASWLPFVSVLKVSDDDAEWLAPGKTPHEAVSEWISLGAEAGPAAILLTRGAEGIDLYLAGSTDSSPLHIPATVVEVADTIGAGDTAMGSVLAGLDAIVGGGARKEEITPREAVAAVSVEEWRSILTTAARAAAITASRHGANPPFLAELKESTQ